jgi:predicted aldo/keto reductase-like oxidoreductase
MVSHPAAHSLRLGTGRWETAHGNREARMDYRKLGRTGLDVGIIGLGTEHLEKSKETWDAVLGMAAERGANYVDLLYVEPDHWQGFGPVLRPYRERLVLAAHWGSGPRYELEFCRETFSNVLSQVGNNYVEIALMTMIDDGKRQGREWREASLEHLHRLQEQGRVGYIGGSAHDTAMAQEVVESGILDVLMFPVNMVGHDHEASHSLYQACVEHGVGLVAMKPYHGGTLFTVDGRPSGITPSQCLEYVFSLPVSTAVPGARNAEEFRQTLHYLEATDEERDYRPVVADLQQRLSGQCVQCNHCLPCPQGIEVGWMIWMVDQARSGVTDDLKDWYNEFDVPASECTECGLCVERCPFEVDTVEKIRRAVELYEP